MLIRQLDLDAHLVLASSDEGDLVDNGHGSLDGIVGSVDGERQVVEADFGFRVGTYIREHRSNIGSGWGTNTALGGIGHDDPP